MVGVVAAGGVATATTRAAALDSAKASAHGSTSTRGYHDVSTTTTGAGSAAEPPSSPNGSTDKSSAVTPSRIVGRAASSGADHGRNSAAAKPTVPEAKTRRKARTRSAKRARI